MPTQLKQEIYKMNNNSKNMIKKVIDDSFKVSPSQQFIEELVWHGKNVL